MTNPKTKRGNYTVKEVGQMLKDTEMLPTEYFRLRAQCLIAICHKFGKRRVEISRLKREDLIINKKTNELEVKFVLAKKKKTRFTSIFSVA